ncbi:hypothetical protein [Bradyrhizobium mercantei]|uniref:hypothetical protein n=1 Tax=Bradyrhizobium mercantei TaxID=1904807 RepID=UPI001FD8B4CA|nr:hypothetical protein [Bradyrhizobium mercantei]
MALLGVTALVAQAGPASAINISASASLPLVKQQQARDDVVQVRAVVRRGGVAVGPRGGAVAYRSRTVVGPGVRPGWHGGGARWVGPRPLPGPRPGGWARPGWYGWPVGGAVAAGAAVGFVTAASAAAAPPAPGMCWYYTDPSRTQGFWDYCPR